MGHIGGHMVGHNMGPFKGGQVLSLPISVSDRDFENPKVYLALHIFFLKHGVTFAEAGNMLR